MASLTCLGLLSHSLFTWWQNDFSSKRAPCKSTFQVSYHLATFHWQTSHVIIVKAILQNAVATSFSSTTSTTLKTEIKSKFIYRMTDIFQPSYLPGSQNMHTPTKENWAVFSVKSDQPEERQMISHQELLKIRAWNIRIKQRPPSFRELVSTQLPSPPVSKTSARIRKAGI